MTSTTPENVQGARKAGPTSYVILSREGSSGPWDEHSAPVTATSADAALRGLLKHAKENEGVAARQWVAIPSRSWQPRKIKVETSTKVTLG